MHTYRQTSTLNSKQTHTHVQIYTHKHTDCDDDEINTQTANNYIKLLIIKILFIDGHQVAQANARQHKRGVVI